MNGQNQEEQKRLRAAFYIDGFNLYHAIDSLNLPHLKWISYRRLAEIMIPQRSQQLVSITYCTAIYPGSERKNWRHEQLIGAQLCHGVEVARGHFVGEPRDCRACSNKWVHPTEKEGDINVALHLMRDAFLDVFDHAYLVSADSDQVATVRMLRKQFPNKFITSVIPPGKKRSEDIQKHVNGGTMMMSADHLERSVMPEIVFVPKIANVRRPHEYAPPVGWIHPDNRPRK